MAEQEIPDDWNATPPEDNSWEGFHGLIPQHDVDIYLNHRNVGHARFNSKEDADKFHAMLNGES